MALPMELRKLFPRELLEAIRAQWLWCSAASFVIISGAALYAFLAEPYYIAEARVLPPKSVGFDYGPGLGMAAGIDMASSMFRDPNHTYVSIMKSRSLAYGAVEKFALQKTYRKKTRIKAYNEFKGRLDVRSNAKDGIITVAYRDRDPARATAIVEYCLGGFIAKMDSLHRVNALRRKGDVENRLHRVASDIGRINGELAKSQGKSGIAIPEMQMQTTASTKSQLQLLIAQKRTEVGALHIAMSDDNPLLKTAKNELRALEGQLRELDLSEGASRKFLEIDSILRKKMILQATFEALVKQIEFASLNEERANVDVQILDPPILPEEKAGPRRALILAVSLFLSGVASAGLVLFKVEKRAA